MVRGRKQEQISQQAIDQWVSLRDEAKADLSRRAQGKLDQLAPLDAIAWLSASNDVADHLIDAVSAARKDGASWTSVALALGESGDKASANRVKNRFFGRL